MWMLASSIYAGCKWLTWRRTPVRAPIWQHMGYLLAWPGLDAAAFMRKPGTTTRRNLLTEWFFVDNNRIRTIYAAMYYPPPEMPVPNWPPYDGNWPLPATFVPATAPASAP
jgi:hypothetical protein